jgi:ABC transport system ATP-binding/permease protein
LYNHFAVLFLINLSFLGGFIGFFTMEESNFSRIIMKEGPVPGEIFPFRQDEMIIGRAEGSDLVIDSPGVSRRHARIIRVKNGYQLEDLGSSNGTYVNGNRLTTFHLLQRGDVIRFGGTVVYEYLPAEAEVTRINTTVNPAATMAEQMFGPAATVIGEEDFQAVGEPAKSEMIVTIAGDQSFPFPLEKPEMFIGRGEDNDIVINSRIVSRKHARLTKNPHGYEIQILPEASNPIFLDGRPLKETRQLQHGDTLRIGSQDPGTMVSMVFNQPVSVSAGEMRHILFEEKTLIQIGRDPSNDVVLDTPTVSRFHAQIEKVGQRYRLTDLNSANGTFVNDSRLKDRDIWLNADDVVRIGRHRFVLKQDQLAQFDDTRGLRVDAVGLNKWVRKDLNILQDISLTFQPREFVVVVGQSGGGKSTLVDAIIGYRPATHGQVMVNGTNVYRNFEAVRDDIGFVPQRDIIHTGLTVYQALDYTARLRMPRDTSKEERHKRIMEVLEDLDLVHRKDNEISRLSGGQQKRVSIGVELLTSPGLFFLDEPTSGLDPGTETALMHLMRRLADQGRTIVLVTHATKNVMLADKVVFLARGGYLAWFGPPDEALRYFDSFRSERERRARAMEFDQIYAILDDPSRGTAKDWAARFQEHPAYQQYVIEAQKTAPIKLEDVKGAPPVASVQKPPAARPKRRRTGSALHQFIVLSARNMKILVRDRSSLILMLIAPPLVAMLDFIIAPLMGSSPFSFQDGNASNGAITLFLMTIYCLLVAGLSQMREFVKEEDIYKRERLVNLKIVPYVASKVWVALLLAFYHAAAYSVIHFLAFDMPGGWSSFGLVYGTMVLAAMAGMVCGLLASALAPAASSAPMIMIMLIIPQIVLSGALAPVPPNISMVASTRWAFEGLIGIAGIGSTVAADPCWQLEPELRKAMTLQDKEAQGCRCMGTAIFKEGSCTFPGVGQYYAAELDMPAPIKPGALGPRPPDPVIPPAPEAPSDQEDQVAVVQYLNALQEYQDEVNAIQDEFKSQMALYESEASVFQAEMEEYQKTLVKYETARNSAIERAEGLIENITEEFGWAWINKEDPAVFRAWLINAWGSQLAIVGAFIIGILILIKRKDNMR